MTRIAFWQRSSCSSAATPPSPSNAAPAPTPGAARLGMAEQCVRDEGVDCQPTQHTQGDVSAAPGAWTASRAAGHLNVIHHAVPEPDFLQTPTETRGPIVAV